MQEYLANNLNESFYKTNQWKLHKVSIRVYIFLLLAALLVDLLSVILHKTWIFPQEATVLNMLVITMGALYFLYFIRNMEQIVSRVDTAKRSLEEINELKDSTTISISSIAASLMQAESYEDELQSGCNQYREVMCTLVKSLHAVEQLFSQVEPAGIEGDKGRK